MANVLNTLQFHHFVCQYRDETVDMTPVPRQLGNRNMCDLDGEADRIVLIKYDSNQEIKLFHFEISYHTELNGVVL